MNRGLRVETSGLHDYLGGYKNGPEVLELHVGPEISAEGNEGEAKWWECERFPMELETQDAP